MHNIVNFALMRLHLPNEMRWMTLFVAVCIMIGLFSGCKKDDQFITDSAAQLAFSVDTLRFDTVFTTLGSATRILKVFNRNDQPIQISNISLDGKSNTKFRFNVDGISDETFEQVTVLAEDSIYVFGEVTIDPDQPLSSSPFILYDELVFVTNGNTQRVTLEAFGQNANYIPSTSSDGEISVLSCQNESIRWDDPKPYVIYGVLVVDSCELILPAGTHVYVHGGLARTEDEQGEPLIYNDGILFFTPNASLTSEGTLDEPVTIEGDRLEEGFDDIPGQWAGLRFSAGSRGNYMRNTTIKNSIIGARVDSAANLVIEDCQIYNTAGAGLIGLHAQIKATNSLFYGNGSNAVQLEYGGIYDFDYCTLASYGVDASALRVSNAFCLDQLCQNFRINPIKLNIRNSIIVGSREDEIDLFNRIPDEDPAFFDYKMKNCLIRVKDLPTEDFYTDFFDRCAPCINGSPSDSLFMSIRNDDYHLDTMSMAEMNAAPLQNILLDLDGQSRDMTNPDIGCYEFQ